MTKNAHYRVALEAARFLADGTESEYLQAKQRALMALGLSDQTRLPSNRQIKELIGTLVRSELGEDEVKSRLREMRTIAVGLMEVLEDHDPFLIGSTLTGEIRSGSDIDLHAYTNDYEEIVEILEQCGYEDIEVETVVNRKGEFVHLHWSEEKYPVEITLYQWSWRDVVMVSSVTGKPMKRADLAGVKRLIAER